MPSFPGTPPYGPGTPAVAEDLGGKIAANPYSGDVEGSRKIDPKTRDYDISATTGRVLGMTNAQQLVYLAVSTEHGSSAMRELGHKLRQIKRITSNIETRVDVTLREAVQHIVDMGLIEVVDTSVQLVRPGTVLGRLRWRDLDTGEVDSAFTGQETQSASRGILLPFLTSINYDLADTAGGQSVTLTGYRLASATACTVGGTSATITANTSTSLTFTMPAKTAGEYDVSVTTSVGTSNPLTIEAWSPAEITSLQGYWPDSFTGSPWGGGLSTMTEATNPPATGTAVNGYTPAAFDGTDDLLSGNSMNSYVLTKYTVAALIYVDSFTVTDPGADSPFNCTSVLADNSSFSNGGPSGGVGGSGSAGVWRYGHYDTGAGAWKSASVSITTAAWILVMATYDGVGTIRVKTNLSDWALAGATGLASGVGSMTIGPDQAGTSFFHGRVLYPLVADDVIEDADLDRLRRYHNIRYALAL